MTGQRYEESDLAVNCLLSVVYAVRAVPVFIPNPGEMPVQFNALDIQNGEPKFRKAS
jgi:hypothetical protein